MIYINTHTPTLVVINGTDSADFHFVNNQTHDEFDVDIYPLGLPSQRKQTAFVIRWFNTTTDMGAEVIDGEVVIRCPSGEYNYQLGCVKGLMRLTDEDASSQKIYEEKPNNVVYNG